ncbi:PHP domain-containing protein [Devosia sp. A16]|uniref:PHP domain-containing protein n=1 Tax=Devosia sp. A16 TaxID=1736675 RepID=UPI0006D820A2|nr:CehA/McbA family metallohydrolase [Devosia sp. A16]
MLSAFSAPGRFWKGNLHTHSNRSDGALEPAEVCRRYREAGYDFLCLSDHFLSQFSFPLTDTREYRTAGFTTLIGAELHAPATHLGDLWHILAVGLPHDFAPTPEGEDGPALARRAAAAGAFVGIAHPQWYGLDFTDGLALDAAHAVEIYNHTCEMLSARPDGVALFDDLLTRGRQLTGFASDDAHFHADDSFGGWVQVKSETLAPEALLAALKAGNYYASTGPEIVSIDRAGEVLRVAASPVRSIVLAGPGAKSTVVHGEAITEAELDLSRFAGSWCRVLVTDSNGKRAWAQPFTV